MDDRELNYFVGMEERMAKALATAALALHQRMQSLEAAAIELRVAIERLMDHVENTAERRRRD
jgi:hypothetical protein